MWREYRPPHPKMAAVDISPRKNSAAKSIGLNPRLRPIPKGIANIPINGNATPSAHGFDLRTMAALAGTWTVTVTLVAAAPAAIV